MAGITAHNIGVLRVLAGRDDEAEVYFHQAIALKEAAFGKYHHHEVALSWNELGTQLFAKGQFESALAAFRRAYVLELRSEVSSPNLEVAMLLNNIACCDFQMGNHVSARHALAAAREIQQEAMGTSAQTDLDLLNAAIVLCNSGYLNLALRKYEEARSLFEEALLIQQSVLDDSHRAIRDTRSNIEITNVFHSLD